MHYKVTIVQAFLLLSLICSDTRGLKCFSCLNFACPDGTDPVLCHQAHQFARERLNDIYYNYGSQVPECPSIDDDDAWESFAMNSSPCREEGYGEAACALGRIRITTFIEDLKDNVTSYGTAFSCAKRKLVDITNKATYKNECGLVMGQSQTRNSMRNIIEIQHCSTITDICREDFCITRAQSAVKPFVEDVKPSKRDYYMIIMFIVIALILGSIVGVCFFAGIFYDIPA